MWAAVMLGFTWLKTRAVQIGGGAIGMAVLGVIGIAIVVGGVVWLKNTIVDGAIASRDLGWMKTLTAANDRLRKDVEAESAKRERASNIERDKARAAANAAVDQTRELEQELAMLKENPVCYTPEVTRILRK